MKEYCDVIILGGFLGSGKTTLLNNLLKNLDPESPTAVIINDFGDVNIDGLIVEKGRYSKKDISGGCICCSLKEKLLTSLASILEEEGPDRIYIEATGLAVPWDMKESIEKGFSSSRLRVKQVLVCVDALQFDRFHDPLPIYKRQFCGSPHILMTKADLHEARFPALEEKIRSRYPLIASLLPVAGGRVDTDRLPDPAKEGRLSSAALIPGLFSGAAVRLQKDGIVQLSFKGRLRKPVGEIEELILENRETLLRVKGLLNPPAQEMMIIHFDGDQLRCAPFSPENAHAHVYPPEESQLILFCLDEDRKQLEAAFTESFA